MRVKVIILAAGQGKRFKAPYPKVLADFRGKPMVAWVRDAVVQANVTDRPVVVVGVGAEQVKAALGEGCDYVFQEKQLGTGHAVAQCRSLLAGKADAVLVLYGDQPLVTGQTIKKLVDEYEQHNPTITLATATVPDFDEWRQPTARFGRILRNRGVLWGIIEAKDATAEQLKIHEVNAGYYCFDGPWLWECVDRLPNNNIQREYYVTDLVALAVSQNHIVHTISIPPRQALGANSPEELEVIEKLKFQISNVKPNPKS